MIKDSFGDEPAILMLWFLSLSEMRSHISKYNIEEQYTDIFEFLYIF